LLQRYNIAGDKSLYPSLILSAGGLFEMTTASGTTEGVHTDSEFTRFSPYADLALRNALMPAGLSFRRREESSKSNGISSPKQIQDEYSANLGWRPSQLPSLNLFYSRRYFYDPDRVAQDFQTDSFNWTSSYQEVKGLELNYSGSYTDSRDRIALSESETLTNSGRVAYSRFLFDNRVIFHSGYSVSLQDSSVTSRTAGKTIYLQLPAVSQLFSTTPDLTAVPPTSVEFGTLVGAPQSVNLVAPQNSLPPAAQNNIGLSFVSSTSVTTLFLPVTSFNRLSGAQEAPSEASLKSLLDAGFFAWDVYTSDDGLNWSQGAVSTSVSTNPVAPGNGEVGFLFAISGNTVARYFKVVQTPRQLPFTGLPDDIDPNRVLGGRLQAFTSSTQPSLTTSTLTGTYDLNLRAKIFSAPDLSYDLNFVFNHNKSDTSALTTSYQLSNGLSLQHRLSEIATGSARVTEDFSLDSTGKVRNGLSYNAGVALTPLTTLSHSLTYGGRIDWFEGERTVTNSIYLNNSAELYRGLSLNIGAGYSTSSLSSGLESRSVTFTAGTDIVPNKDFTLSLGYQDSEGAQTGGGLPGGKTYTRSGSAVASYRPWEAIYLVAGYSLLMQNDRPSSTLQNYGVSWSPFRGGDLQFNMNYTETLQSAGNQKDTTIGPSLRWNIRPGSSLTISYGLQKTRSDTSGSVDSTSASAQLRIAL